MAFPGRLTIVEGDALRMDLREHVGGETCIVANLPYNVSTALLTQWLTAEPWPPWYRHLTLMFQREVADRICASPGTKAYGRLSVLAQWRTHAEKLFDIDPRAFTPPPKVTSTVVHFKPRAKLEPPCAAADLQRVTAAAFGQRRKMLRSSLKSLVNDPLALLEAAGLAGERRAEESIWTASAGLRSVLAKLNVLEHDAPDTDPAITKTLEGGTHEASIDDRLRQAAGRTTADTPAPTGSEVIVRISHCGVCHSDVHMHDGYFELGGGRQLDVKAGREMPFTLGHEIAGEVEAVGPDVEGVEIGRHFAVYPWIGCGECGLCQQGDEHLCNTMNHLGIYKDGGFATHVVVPHQRYLLSTEGSIPSSQAATCAPA